MNWSNGIPFVVEMKRKMKIIEAAQRNNSIEQLKIEKEKRMKTWMRLVGICFLAMFVVGCAAKERGPSPKSTDSSPEIVEKHVEQKSEEVEPKAQEPVVSRPKVKVTAHRLNLREKGSAKSLILSVLIKGEELEIMSREGSWLEIKTETGDHGWVYGRYVMEIEAVTAIPLAPPEKRAETEKISKLEIDKEASPIEIEDLKSDDVARKTEQPTQIKKTPASSTSLRADLENLWTAYLKANHSGDLKRFKETSSANNYATLVNMLASAGNELTPDVITSMAELLPDPSKLEFVEMIENGPTAGLVYVEDGGDSDNPNIPSPIKFNFIKFVQEPSGWKVDGMLTIGKPKYQRDGSETRFEHSDILEELAIDGKVLDAPQPMAKAEVKGVIDVSSYGYKTEVTINGVKQSGAKDSNSSGYIEGGLKKGENHIEIVISSMEGTGSDWEPSVKIRYLDAAGEGKEAFLFEPEKEFEGRHSFTFRISE